MKFIHVYTTWMLAIMVARIAELITKPVFEALFIIGIAVAAGLSYKSLCEARAFDRRHALCRTDSKKRADL